MDTWQFEGYGQTPYNEIVALAKALEANESITDSANLTDVGALQYQSLEGTLASLVATDDDFVLWNDLPKSNAWSTIEEYDRQTGYGVDGGGWMGQMETPSEADPTVDRQLAYVKFNRQLWKVADVAGMVRTVKDAEAIAKQAAVFRCMRGVTQSLYRGNSSYVPESIDGFEKAIIDGATSDHIVDVRGGAVTQGDFRDLAELIRSNFGKVNGAGLYVSPSGMSALAQSIENLGTSNGQRIIQGQGGNGIDLGFGVNSIVTPFGKIIPKTDVFIAGEYEGRTAPTAATSDKAPAAPTLIAAVTTGTPGSKFLASTVRPSGSVYRYAVCAVNAYGLSARATVAMDSVVAAGGSCTITITPGAGAYPASCFEVYSELVAGSGEYRYMGRVAANGTAAVTYTDKNDDIPGTTKMFLLDLTSSGERRAFTLSRLAPLYSEEYSKLGPYRWGAANMYLTPKYYAPKRFAMIKNVGISVDSMSTNLNI